MSYQIKGNHAVYELVCGLEVHAQVSAKSKLFSGASASFGAGANQQVSLIDAGFPGMLPVINEFCVEQAVKSGIGLNATINPLSVFERKNYFYPDLPQGYQISQFAQPIVGAGAFDVELPDGSVSTIGITRLHLEQDAGKSIHDEIDDETLIDLNRAGCALMEIVSDPDIRSPDEAYFFLKKLRSILRYLGTCDGNMEEGSLRCDANVSVRPVGQSEFNTRCEIKNLNSMRFVSKAIQYEAQRQVELVESGGTVVQETRLYDSDTNTTRTMRGKEEAHDYRYFPDPDLPPLVLPNEQVAQIRTSMPELPDKKRERFVHDYGLTIYDAQVLTEDKALADYFESASTGRSGKLVANWIINDLLGYLGREEIDIENSPITHAQINELVDLIEKSTITGRVAKDIFAKMAASGKNPKHIVETEGLEQVSDSSSIEPIVDQLIANNPSQSEQAKHNTKLIGWFTGQVMQETKGKADPKLVQQLLRSKLL